MLGRELPVGTYSVSQFAWEMKGLIADAYPSVWVAGEIQRVRAAARGQLYFELIEKGRGDRVKAKLDCVIWADDRVAVEAVLQTAGVELTEGTELRCAGRPDFWPGGGRLQFTVAGVDPLFSLGALERRRRATLKALEAEGLLEQNQRLSLAAAPLQLGLVTSKGSAAYHDFLDTLMRSGFGFEVRLVHAAMQGAAAEDEIAHAFASLHACAAAGTALDAIVLIRGGGSRSDLATFDSRRVARAVARAGVPVVCGIGHQIDQSIADMVAHTSCKTPTEAAEFLVSRAAATHLAVEAAARQLAGLTLDRLRAADRRLASLPQRLAVPSRALLRVRSREQRSLEGQITRAASRVLASGSGECNRQVRRGLAAAWRLLAGARKLQGRRRDDLLRSAFKPVHRASERVAAHGRLCAQVSPERTLERGFSLTRRADGIVVRRLADVSSGTELSTEVADGTIRSTVDSVAVAAKVARKRRQGETR